ncbi:MAG: hypothetical protein P1V35_12960, partial [Planctomycetota bacterium]|nr:hypothetical protein [Planctomycetota bacterium]
MFSIAVSAFCVQDGEPGDEPSEEPDVPEEPGQDPEEGEDESPGTGTEGEGEGETEEEEVPRIPLEAILTVPSRAKEAKACSGCSATERVTLCGEHAEAENAAFEILATTWGDLDDHQKVDTLVEISNLTSQHVNAPSPRVATFLVERLKDERSGYVRAASAIALGWGQDPAIALPPLMKILKDRQKKNPKLRSKLQKLTDEFYSRSAMVVQLADYLEATGFQLTQAGAEGLEQDLKHLLPLIKELEKASTHYIWEEHMLAASAQAIGRIPDRRCAKALLKAASTWDAKMALDGIAEGLLANGTRSCVRAAIK